MRINHGTGDNTGAWQARRKNASQQHVYEMFYTTYRQGVVALHLDCGLREHFLLNRQLRPKEAHKSDNCPGNITQQPRSNW